MGGAASRQADTGGVLPCQDHQNKRGTHFRPYGKKLLRFLLAGGWKKRGLNASIDEARIHIGAFFEDVYN